MRTALALVGLVCGAASAYAAEPAKWCTDSPYDGGAQEELVISDTGTMVNGNWIQPGMVRFATIDNGQERVVIYRGRVFWPCK